MSGESSERAQERASEAEAQSQMPASTPSAAGDDQRIVDEASSLLEAVQRERDEMEQRLLRTAADYQNYVRRSQQNVRQAAEQQLLELGRAMVTVLDHFDHATAVDPEATGAQTLLEGVNIVRNELLRTLERFGIHRLEVGRGDSFDPEKHEALMREEDADVEPGHVVRQLQPGYVLDDKTLRPAKVALAAEA